MWRFLALFVTLCLISVSASKQEEKLKEEESVRDKKLFSLFSVVTFKNVGCTTNSGSGTNRNGTCYTASECSSKGGSASGNCAAGFGVCCLFTVTTSASTINENCTYIRNPSFPSAYSSTTSITYTVNKCSADVCAIRLDFETFTIDGPTTTAEQGSCVDSFVVTGTSGLSSPTICGKNTGQHVYMDIGMTSTATATLAFTFASTTSTTRTWEIKATQIPCAASYRPPSGCLQYHTGLTGRFQTFNFLESTTMMHLASQEYNICIRQEEGYCCVSYQTCSDTGSWSIDNDPTAKSQADTSCAEDYIGIDGATLTCERSTNAVLHSRICGGKFNAEDSVTVSATTVCDCTAPFVVEVKTNAAGTGTEDDNTARGVCLEYSMIPCEA